MPQLPAKLQSERILALRYAYSLGVNLGMEDACHAIEPKTKRVILDNVRNMLPLENLRFCRKQANMRKTDATARDFLLEFAVIASQGYNIGFDSMRIVTLKFGDITDITNANP